MATVLICLLTLALCLSSGFQQGYIASVLNQPYLYIQQFMNETIHERIGVHPPKDVLNVLWSCLNIAYPIASIVGQFIAARICRKYGMRGTALITCVLYLPGTFLCSLSMPARSFELLFLGRILWSIAIGINSVNSTVWLIECAPPSIRGGISCMQEFSMAIGAVVCQTAGLPFSTDSLWPLIFLLNLPLVGVCSLLLFCMPDAPSSILMLEKDVDKARLSLSRYYGVPPDDESIDKELFPSKKRKEGEEEGKTEEKKESINWLFSPFSVLDDKKRVIRQAAWLGVMVKIAYVFTGARCLRSYTTFILHYLSKFSLEHAKLGSWIISLARVPATLVPVVLVDRLGRRSLLTSSMVITVLSLVMLMVAIVMGGGMKYVSFVSFMMLILVNSAGVGSVSRFYAAELVPRSMLLEAMSILNGLETLIRIGADFAFYPVANVIGVYSLLMFVVPSVVFLIAIWALCPETSGKSVHQVLNNIALRKNLKVSFAT